MVALAEPTAVDPPSADSGAKVSAQAMDLWRVDVHNNSSNNPQLIPINQETNKNRPWCELNLDRHFYCRIEVFAFRRLLGEQLAGHVASATHFT